jgi:putative MATE family efflux protein
MVERKTLSQLSVPICLETLFYMLSGMVDTLMLSSVSDQAVGAVGTANTYIGVFIVMFGVISSGMIAVMSQNIGAGRPGIAYQARQLGLMFNAFIGILMSVVLAIFSGRILKIVSIAPALFEPAETYLKIVGGTCFLNALIPIFSSYLRVFGYTKHSLIGTIVGNVLNIILNSVFLFVFNWGVMGVAVATVISRVVNLVIVAVMGAVLIKAKQSPDRILPRKILAQIVKIGFPSAFETALYNIAMTFIVRFMNQMDANGMNVTARSYAMQIANFSYCAGAALAQANAIMTGWRIGAKEFEECDRGIKKAEIYGLVIATCFSVTFALFGHIIVHIFTDDAQMISLVVKLLIIDIFLELGRVTNLVYSQALKTSGDAVFPVIMGAIFMYLFAVGGTYFLGIHLGFLAVGAYIAMAGDECARAVGMVLRWKSGKWKSKSLIEL